MADTKAKEDKISIKVFVDKVKKRVVYAEADHSFVDILFSFMTMPMGTIVRLLGKHDGQKSEVLESLNNLYQSLKDLPECYFATEDGKFMLLNPRSQSYDHCRNLKLKIDDSEPTKYFECGTCYWHYRGNGTYCMNKVIPFSIYSKAKCSRCGQLMDTPQSFPSSVCAAGGGVFVSDIATFIVMDDFSVMPYSTAAIFQLLTDSGFTDSSHLEERLLELGSEQMLYLLKMALSLDSPLTRYIFHKNNSAPDLDGPCQGINFDQFDLVKKEESTTSKIVLEVTLQKSTGRVLFTEAKEDFVDFVFGFLSIPLGTVVGTLLNGTSSMRCMENIFKSITSMSVGRYLKSQDIKDMLVKPHSGQPYNSKNIIFPLKGSITTLQNSGYSFQLRDPRLNQDVLKPSGLFFVTDDLVIIPSSSHVAINTLNKLQVKFDDIQKFEISIGLEEGLKMLKDTLRCKSPLTSIIMHQLKK